MKKRGTKFKTKLIAFLLFLSFCGFGTSKYWVASSASNWNNTANWSLSSGGVNGAAVPGSGDVAIFDGGSLANCSIDATVNVAGFNVTSSYTGLISQNSFKITIGASNAVFSGGTFSGGTNSININGTFTISGTAFTSTSGSFNIKNPGTNPIVFSSGSFSHNNGSVTLTTNGTSNNYSISGSFIFNNLTLLGTFNTFSFTSPNIINGNFSLNASIGGTTVALNSMTVNGTTTLSGNNAIILSSGTLFANGDIITSFTGDPYSTGTGVINISGIGNQTMNTSSPAGQGILSNITINKSSGTLTLIGNISLFGTWNYIQGVVDAISNASTVIFPEGNSSILNGQGTSSAMTFYNVTVNLASAVTVTLGGNLIISNNLTLNNSSGSTILDATTNGYNISIGGSFVGQSNTSFLQRNSTVILNGSTTQILQLGTNTSGGLQNGFYNLTINNTGGGAQLLANNFFVTNNLILTTGNINLNNLTLTLGINSTTGTGSLTQTNGWLYGGTFTRWLATSSIIVPSTTGLFPMGSASDYCPFWLGSSTNLTSGGTVSVNFNPYSISNPGQPTTSVPIDSIPGHIPTQAGIGIVDGTWPNGSGGFLSYYGLTNSYWDVTTANGFTPNGNTLNIRYGGGATTFSNNTLSDLAAETAMRSIGSTDPIYGSWAASTNKYVTYEVNRIGISLAGLINTNYWRIGTTNTVNSPLPISLISFSAFSNENKVDLKWETATETNNAYFTIEKSKDGINFNKFIDVPGANNSTSYRNYIETDYQPYDGISYYRLKQTDFNGDYKFLDIVPINFNSQQDIFVYPSLIDNSTGLNINISGYKNQEVIVVLQDMQGREFLYKILLAVSDNQIFIVDETQSLSSGTYIVRATTNDKIYNYKLIVK